MIHATEIRTTEGQSTFLANLFKTLRINPEAVLKAYKAVYGEN